MPAKIKINFIVILAGIFVLVSSLAYYFFVQNWPEKTPDQHGTNITNKMSETLSNLTAPPTTGPEKQISEETLKKLSVPEKQSESIPSISEDTIKSLTAPSEKK